MNNAEITKNLIKMRDFADESAFDALYLGTKRGVYAFLISYGLNSYDAEDVTQDTYIKIRASAANFDERGSALGYILEIAKNTAINFLKRNSRTVNFTDKDDIYELKAEESDFSDAPYLKAVLGALEPIDRNIVILHLIDGMKNREIAELLNIPLGTVLWRYNKAIKLLRSKLENVDEI